MDWSSMVRPSTRFACSGWRSLRGWVFVIPCLWFGHGGIDATSPDWSDELSGWCVERAWQAAAGCAGGSVGRGGGGFGGGGGGGGGLSAADDVQGVAVAALVRAFGPGDGSGAVRPAELSAFCGAVGRG